MSSNPETTGGIVDVASIDDLHLEGQEIEVDYTLPEPGSSFPPRLKPGIYDFKFELEDDPFGQTTWEKEGQHFFEVRHKAVITRTNPDGSQEDVTIRFIRATAFRNEAMRKASMNSQLAELLRSLSIVLEKPISELMVKDALRAADGRAYGRMGIGWRARFQDSETVYSTTPRKKRNETAWPKDDNGQYSLLVTDPATGAKAYGREQITNYYFPISHNHEAELKGDVSFS